MATALPKILKNFNMMVDGTSFAGKCESVTPPNLTLIEEDYRAGGMDGKIGIDMGTEKMELKASFAEHSPVLFRQFGLADGASTQVLFRGAQSDGKDVQAYVVEAQGRCNIAAPSEIKVGDKNPVDITFSLTYYKLMVGGQPVIEIDVLGMKRKIGGVDQLEKIRQLIG